jgi:DnaJ-class molecular chaperone
MKKRSAKPAERKCPACKGTGYPVVVQPVKPGRRIYPVRCKNCGGKGRIPATAK